MKTITLNEQELAILGRQDPETETDGGWQSLLVGLQKVVQDNGVITLTDTQLERIPRYAFNYGNGGWEGRLLGVFGRTLGPGLDGHV
ncbi:MAG: aspartyl-tRNA synthetase [Verrucomicrobiaceae bacterium]|nr:aspartyl-tRNA synthetase [Verrucomicrobiaceae bacterium]